MTIVNIAGLLLAAGFVYVVVPRIIFPLERVGGRALDRAVAGLVLMSALTMAVMYLLGTFGLLETLGILPFWVLTWWLCKGRHRSGRGLGGAMESTLGVFDHVERRGVAGGLATAAAGPRQRIALRIRATIDEIRAQSPGAAGIVLRVLAVVVLCVCAWLRYSRAIHHVDLVPQDSYLALSWDTFLNKGRLLADGTYPQGAYMWMSMIGRFYPGGLYNLVRFGGPLMNVVELGLLYWAVSRTTASRAAGVVSMAVLGLFAGNPQLLVTWPRQIGAMTYEFAIAFGLVSVVFAASYLSEHNTFDLVLAGAAMFIAVTSNTLVIPLLVVGYLAVLVAGVVLGGWSAGVLGRLVGVGLLAVIAASYFFFLGAVRGTPLVDSFTQYLPNNHAGFSATVPSGTSGLDPATAGATVDVAEPPGHELRTNAPFQLAVGGAVLAIVSSVFAGRNQRGRRMLTIGLSALGLLLLYDLVFVRFALLFRTRMAWLTGEIIAIGIGVGLGGAVAIAARALAVHDPLGPRQAERRGVPAILGLGSLAGAVALLGFLWPLQGAVAREAFASGYPQATTESLRILGHETPRSFTFVGVSEQYQEVLASGFFVEAWVFARDITYSEAKNPAFELPIPTDRVYIFAEKQPFAGPQAPPTGPTQEFYRNAENRARLMGRISQWCELYRSVHHDMTIVYDDPQLRIYEVSRRVNLERASQSHMFVDYTWRPGQYFTDDRDLSLDQLTPR